MGGGAFKLQPITPQNAARDLVSGSSRVWGNRHWHHPMPGLIDLQEDRVAQLWRQEAVQKHHRSLMVRNGNDSTYSSASATDLPCSVVPRRFSSDPVQYRHRFTYTQQSSSCWSMDAEGGSLGDSSSCSAQANLNAPVKGLQASTRVSVRPNSQRRVQSTKKCNFPGCEHNSVTRNRCRGHGGGRRCVRYNCDKAAQSRSCFCWAHGGGQRCEASGCMRSKCTKKSKRFCSLHLSYDSSHTRSATKDPCASSAQVRVLPSVDFATQVVRECTLASLYRSGE